MLSSNGNPFLRAEYLNPPPATNTMDTKKSPLALLAQTCSQIGADPLPTSTTKTSSATTTSSSTASAPTETRKKSASECLQQQQQQTDAKTSPSTPSTANAEPNNNRLQRPSSSGAAQSSINATIGGKTTSKKTTSNELCNTNNNTNNRLTPTDRRSKSSSPKNVNRLSAGGNAMDHQPSPTVSASTGLMSHLHLHPSQQQQQQLGNSHASQHHLMMAAALAHGSSDSSSSSSSSSSSAVAAAASASAAAAAMSLANSYKSLMASAYPPTMSPYPHSPYSGHHPASMAGGGGGGGYGSAHPSALDFSAYASALNAAAVAKSSSLSSNGGNPFIPTSASASMMNGYLASQVHPAYSVAALQQAMHQQHYGNVANRLNSTASASTSASSKSAGINGDPCRDPYCTGCPANGNNNNNNSGTGSSAGQIHMVCTAGCGLAVQCDHVKVPIAAHHLQFISGPASSPSAANGPPSSPHNSNNRPYICNWIVGDNYCGKRFTSSDDLLQHLRTHTNLSSAAAAAAAGVAPPPPVLPPLPPSDVVSSSAATAFAHPSSMMRAAYPTPPLSPLSAARYHPYGKSNASTTSSATSLPPQQPGPFSSVPGLFHPGMAAAMAAMAAGPYGPAPGQSSPAAHLFHMNPALAPYYSHLSLFAHQAGNHQPSTRQMPGLGPAPLGGGAGLGGLGGLGQP